MMYERENSGKSKGWKMDLERIEFMNNDDSWYMNDVVQLQSIDK